MEEKYKIIPVNFSPGYTAADISVVVPQWHQHKNRIVWFLKQYVRSTPPEIVRNTWIICDEKDSHSKELLSQYNKSHGVNFDTVSHSDWSTYKQLLGFQKVKTRLCVKLHNDICILRTDWIQSLLDKFNETREPQLLGGYHRTSDIDKGRLEKFVKTYPIFGELYEKLEFAAGENGLETTGASYVTAYVTVTQTYVFQSLYPQIVELEGGKMDKEDCLFTLLVSLNRIKISSWVNMHEFLFWVTNKRADFDSADEFQYPVSNNNYPPALWEEAK